MSGRRLEDVWKEAERQYVRGNGISRIKLVTLLRSCVISSMLDGDEQPMCLGHTKEMPKGSGKETVFNSAFLKAETFSTCFMMLVVHFSENDELVIPSFTGAYSFLGKMRKGRYAGKNSGKDTKKCRETGTHLWTATARLLM